MRLSFFTWLGLALWTSLCSWAEEPVDLGLLAAVELTLEQDPDIFTAASDVESARAGVMIASSRFDSTVTAEAIAADSTTPTSETSETEARGYEETLGLRRVLRTGQTLEPEISLEQQADPAVSTGTFSFTISQPLWRGRRPSVVTADERASELDLAASRYDFLHRIALRLRVVITQYWVTRAAMLDLEILRETEARSKELLETTKRLVQADITPAAELIQLEADVISREASRIAGERSLFQARQDLRAEIGLAPGEYEDLGQPADEFPTVSADRIPAGPRAYLAEAWISRADLAADKERLQAAEIRLESASDALKPLLDLRFTPSFTGLIEDNDLGDALTAVGNNVPGLSTLLSLNYSFPIENRAAEGRLLRSTASVERAQLGVDSRRIQIGTGVPSAFDAVRSNSERLVKLERAVELFEKTLENEQKKLKVGSSILIDVLNQRDRLTSVQRSLVQARLDLARALVSLRFETGTLVRPATNGVQTVRLEDLTTLPLGGG